jgi:hypothetical protein
MAEPVKRMDDYRYPEPLVNESAPAGLPAANAGLLPPSESEGHERLNHTAEALGTAVGTAVDRMRQLPDRFAEMRQRFTVIQGRARDRASMKAADLRDTAEKTAYRARTRAELYANEYPVQVILGIAAASFVLGFVLRLWRSNRG